MTHSPQDPIDRLSNIVERFINATVARMDQMEQVLNTSVARMDQMEQVISTSITRMDRQDSTAQQLERGHLRLQEQLGHLAGILDRALARQERHDQELEDLRQRQRESDQRFDILLQEIRFLIRQQRDPDVETTDDTESDGSQ